MNIVADTADRKASPFRVTNALVLSIALPMTLGFVTTPLLGLTDTAVIGQTGRAADLAGLGVAAVIFDLIFSIIGFIRTSTTAFVAQAFGRGDPAEEQAVFWRATATGAVGGLAVILAGSVILYLGLLLIAPEPAAAAVATTYFFIRVLSSPFRLINDALLGYVLGRGRGGMGLFLQILVNGTNIVLSILLGLVAGWGVAGVAWGTVLADVTGVAVGLGIVLPGFRRTIRPTLSQVFDRMRFMALMAINRDIIIRSLLLVGSFALMTRAGAQLGTGTLAANSLLMNFFMVAAFFLDGMAAAAEQLAGRSLGASDRSAFRDTVKLTLVWSLGLSAILGAAFLLWGSYAIEFLTTSKEVRNIAEIYLPWMALTAITGALAFQMDGIYMGTAWSAEMRNMMILSFIGFCAVLWLGAPLWGNHGIWAALNLFLALRGVTLAAILPGKANQMFLATQ